MTNINKIISIALIFILITGMVLANTASAMGGVLCLRVPMLFGNPDSDRGVKLTPSLIYSLYPEVKINSAVETFRHRMDFTNDLMLSGYALKFGSLDLNEDMSYDNSVSFKLGRLTLTCFRNKKDKGFFVFMISNEDSVAIGHGFVAYYDNLKECQFRYSIHDGGLNKEYSFRNKGYGSETLVCIMAMCINGKLFGDEKIDRFTLSTGTSEYISPEETIGLKNLIKKFGFNDDLSFDMSLNALNKKLPRNQTADMCL